MNGEAEKTEPAYDDTYLRGRIDDNDKKIRMIMAILVDKKMVGEALGKRIEESKGKDNTALLDWLDTELYVIEEALWIQKAKVKKGALRSQLGIKEGEKIPSSILNKIAKAKVGSKISFKGKTFTVTTLLKRRAALAIKFKKMKK